MAFLCTTCGKSFGSSEKLRFHNQIHSEKIFTCKICDKTVIGTKSFNNHIKTHQTFECTLCHSSVKLNSKTSHMKTCSNQESKNFKCSECPYIVDRHDRLKTHQQKKLSKIVANKFQCTFCQNKFSTKFNLKEHKKTHLPLPVQSKEFSV